MSDIIRKVQGAIQNAAEVWITAHERPDGDALGTALGLARLIGGQAGIPTRLVGLSPIAPTLEFLLNPGDRRATEGDTPAEGAILVMVDCGHTGRVAPEARALAGRLPALVIDHHEGSGLGHVDWIEPAASSSAELVLRLAAAAGWKLTPAAAAPLWVGMATDTGRFCFGNTSPRALRLAAELVEAGADTAALSEAVWYSPPLAEQRLKARAFASIRLCFGGRLALARLGPEDFAYAQAGPEHAQEIANSLKGTEGARVSVFLSEAAAGTVKVSLRAAPPHDARRFCADFGGGGHQRAAGCLLAPCGLDEAERRILEHAGRLFFPGD